MAEPVADDGLQACCIQAVRAMASILTHFDQSRIQQDAQVARRRRPRTGESARDVTRKHLAAAVVEDEQDVATLCVRQGIEDQLEVLESARGVLLTRPFLGGLRHPE